jgi:hypothetical protein
MCLFSFVGGGGALRRTGGGTLPWSELLIDTYGEFGDVLKAALGPETGGPSGSFDEKTRS